MQELTSQELAIVVGGAGAPAKQPVAAPAAEQQPAQEQPVTQQTGGDPMAFFQIFASLLGNVAPIIQAIAQLKGVGGDNALKYAQARSIDRGQQQQTA
jgi:hypothetical protein